jgi:hypothetical protein
MKNLVFCFEACSLREPVPTPDQVRGRLSLENALIKPAAKKKKDQLSLAQYWGMLLANRPDPDDPGGLGAEESGTERTGPTQNLFLAIQNGGR